MIIFHTSSHNKHTLCMSSSSSDSNSSDSHGRQKKLSKSNLTASFLKKLNKKYEPVYQLRKVNSECQTDNSMSQYHTKWLFFTPQVIINILYVWVAPVPIPILPIRIGAKKSCPKAIWQHPFWKSWTKSMNPCINYEKSIQNVKLIIPCLGITLNDYFSHLKS